MSLIGALVNLVYKTFFLVGESSYRRTPTPLKIVFTIISLGILFYNPYMGSLVILVLISILGGFGYSDKWVYAALTLSSIPGIWYALTAYILGLAGLTESITLIQAFWIYIRTTAISYLILFIASIISPTKTANILLRIKREASTIPLLLWRITPYGLITTMDSLAIGRLKKERTKTRIAPAIASLIEYGELVKEINYYRLTCVPKYPIPIENSLKYTIILLCGIIIEVAIIAYMLLYP
ncbi:MAG: hypothetical protein J7L82_02050 [Staphylothermus sp.]|nr:hypothetical protein [Staphylothermus sp.]